jgi:hypothetical protein
MRTTKFSPTPPTTTVSATTCEKLTTIGPAAISDIWHTRGFHQQVMRHDIQPLDRTVPLAGIARTMLSRPLVGVPTPGREYELLFAAIDGLQPGEVLVTDEADCCVLGRRRTPRRQWHRDRRLHTPGPPAATGSACATSSPARRCSGV